MHKILILSFFLFLSSHSFSQQIWEPINDNALKFKLPNGYDFKETPKAKVYSYQDNNKIISISIFKNDAVKDLKESNEDNLNRYYKGVIDGYIDKAGSEVLSRGKYKIEGKLAYKITSQISYQDGSKNLMDIHISYRNGLNYLATFQYDPSNQDIVNNKNDFFNSFTFKTILDDNKKKEENKVTPITDSSYQTGKLIGRILSYILGIGFIGFIIYIFFYKKKKSTV